MGAWADIDLQTGSLLESLEGYAGEVLSNRESGGFDPTTLPIGRVDTAKNVVRRKILQTDLADEVDRYSGPEGLLDDLAGDANLESMVHEAIAIAALHLHADGNRLQPDGLYDEHGDNWEDDVMEIAENLSAIAPNVLGWTADSGRATGGSFATTMDRSEL